jgi:hypothetical protein
MVLPATITSQVDPSAITKVTRLFNNTIGDVLAELVQNARRAGARKVEIDVVEHAGTSHVRVRDNGAGIADPSVLLALGRSGWNAELAQREDSAGMGVFSLAGRAVTISSQAASSDEGWRISILPSEWESSQPILVEPCQRDQGTELLIAFDQAWAASLETAACDTARFCPVPMTFNGRPVQQVEWLAPAVAVTEFEGVRIGIVDARYGNTATRTVNFHGVTVACAVPRIADAAMRWSARVEIVDAPELQLVLPARKEIVANAALERLREAVRRAIYAHIAERGEHGLSHASWCEAAALGIHLPEARANLTGWSPTCADFPSTHTVEAPGAFEGWILMGSFGAPIEQCAALAMARAGGFAGRLVEPDPDMAGYSWYDALPRISELAIEVVDKGAIFRIDGGELPDLETATVERMDLLMTITGDDTVVQRLPAPVALIMMEDVFCCLEDVVVLLSAASPVTADELADVLEGACFCSSDDVGDDSWSTQHDLCGWLPRCKGKMR